MEPGLWLPSAADSGAAGAKSRQAGVLDAETDRAAAVLAQEERGRLIAADAEHALIPRADGEGERTSGAERVAASVDRERLLGATIEQRLSALASEELQAVELEETGALESSAFPVSALALAAAAPDPFGRPHVEPAPTPAPTPAPARTARPAVPVEPWYRAFLRELETRQPPGQGPAQARRTEDEALTAAAQRKADAPRGAESSERNSAQVAVAAHATEAQTPHSGEVDREKDVSRAAQVELTIANERAATEAQAREVERLIEAELIAIGGLMPEAERLASDERDARERGAADRN